MPHDPGLSIPPILQRRDTARTERRSSGSRSRCALPSSIPTRGSYSRRSTSIHACGPRAFSLGHKDTSRGNRECRMIPVFRSHQSCNEGTPPGLSGEVQDLAADARFRRRSLPGSRADARRASTPAGHAHLRDDSRRGCTGSVGCLRRAVVRLRPQLRQTFYQLLRRRFRAGESSPQRQVKMLLSVAPGTTLRPAPGAAREELAGVGMIGPDSA